MYIKEIYFECKGLEINILAIQKRLRFCAPFSGDVKGGKKGFGFTLMKQKRPFAGVFL